jgi:hypothetical protein
VNLPPSFSVRFWPFLVEQGGSEVYLLYVCVRKLMMNLLFCVVVDSENESLTACRQIAKLNLTRP